MDSDPRLTQSIVVVCVSTYIKTSSIRFGLWLHYANVTDTRTTSRVRRTTTTVGLHFVRSDMCHDLLIKLSEYKTRQSTYAVDGAQQCVNTSNIFIIPKKVDCHWHFRPCRIKTLTECRPVTFLPFFCRIWPEAASSLIIALRGVLQTTTDTADNDRRRQMPATITSLALLHYV